MLSSEMSAKQLIAACVTQLDPSLTQDEVDELTQLIYRNSERNRDSSASVPSQLGFETYCRKVIDTYRQEQERLFELQILEDKEAWLEELQRFYIWALRIARRYANHLSRTQLEDIARSITHIAAAKIAQPEASFPYDCTFDAWAYNFVRNVARHELRKLTTRQNQHENGILTFGDLTLLESILPFPNSPTPDFEFLKNAIAELSQTQRDVIIMHYFEDRSFPTIARLLGKKTNAVHQAHYQALKRLKQLLSAGTEP